MSRLQRYTTIDTIGYWRFRSTRTRKNLTQYYFVSLKQNFVLLQQNFVLIKAVNHPANSSGLQ